MKEFSDCIESSRAIFKTTPSNCHHDYNTLNNDIVNVIQNNKENSEQTFAFVERQTMKIKENADKVFVAPSEDGKWIIWHSDLFLEEKLFPKLFP